MLAVRVGWVLAALISAFATLWGCRDGLLMGPLSDDEVAAVATQLAARGELNIDAADIGVAITRITDELPSPADLDRVQRRLDGIGWPVDPEFSCHAVMLAVRRVCCRRHSKRAPIRSHRAGVRRSWLWQRLLRGTVTAGATLKTGLNDEERKALRAQGFVGEPPLWAKSARIPGIATFLPEVTKSTG